MDSQCALSVRNPSYKFPTASGLKLRGFDKNEEFNIIRFYIPKI